MQELIIGDGGENIARVPIEDQVKAACDGINEVWETRTDTTEVDCARVRNALWSLWYVVPIILMYV